MLHYCFVEILNFLLYGMQAQAGKENQILCCDWLSELVNGNLIDGIASRFPLKLVFFTILTYAR